MFFFVTVLNVIYNSMLKNGGKNEECYCVTKGVGGEACECDVIFPERTRFLCLAAAGDKTLYSMDIDPNYIHRRLS